MNYQKLALVCECGKAPKWLSDVGLTSDQQLVVHWRCTVCRRHVYVVKQLVERQNGPPGEDWDEDVGDRRFLRSLKIRYPDE